jgi:carboxypeptidase Taq
MSPENVAASFQRVMARAGELADLESANALLGWDQETFMPPKAVGGRASVSATLAGLAHDKLTDPWLGDELGRLAASQAELTPDARAQLMELTRLRDRAVKVPATLVRTLAETQSVATAKWAEARAAKDYPSFAPYLEKIFGLKKQEADAIGYAEEPYEALLDEYEPGAKVADIARRLAEVRDFLVPLVAKIKDSGRQPDLSLLAGPYDAAAQEMFGREVVSAMGFDLKAGRLDVSEHPFTSGIHFGDVRLTTRYKEDLSVGLFGTMHEGGHGIYEQNLPEDRRRTPMGASASLGIHESQSRLWENQVGRGRSFWVHWLPRLKELFPAQVGSASLDDFYRAINVVRPSFIRIEADEVTYNLHIVLRFEIERGLLAGTLSVKDLPEIWNTKFEEYLGLVPPSPDLGVMQDIHWAFGLIGYFPTYTLGNVYSAQLYEAAKRAIPDLETAIERGDLLPLKDWMVANVHRWGRRYDADDLIRVATGQAASAEPFTRYLSTKYGALYGLS